MTLPISVGHYRYTDGLLHARCFDGACVVYHALSGDTHRLGKLGFAVLQALSEKPLSLSELLSRLEDAAGDKRGHDLEELVDAFEKAGLVEIVELTGPH